MFCYPIILSHMGIRRHIYEVKRLWLTCDIWARMICPCCLPHPKPLQLDQNYKTRATSIRVPRATADNFLKSKLSKMGIYIWFPFLRTFMDDSIDFSKALKGSNLANKTGRKRKFVKLTQKYKFEHFFEDFEEKNWVFNAEFPTQN